LRASRRQSGRDAVPSEARGPSALACLGMTKRDACLGTCLGKTKREACLGMPSRNAVPSEARDASLTLGKTKEGLLGKTKEGLLGKTKEGLLGKTKEGLLGRTIKRTLGRTK